MFIGICLEVKIHEILTQNIPAEHFVAFSTDTGVSIDVIFCSTKARPQTQRTDRSTPLRRFCRLIKILLTKHHGTIFSIIYFQVNKFLHQVINDESRVK